MGIKAKLEARGKTPFKTDKTLRLVLLLTLVGWPVGYAIGYFIGYLLFR